MSKPLIYLAGPYTHKERHVQEARGIDHAAWAGKLLQQGHIIYSPIAETMTIALHSNMSNTDWDTWREKDLRHIDACDEMWILMLPGWELSRGVRGEVKYCLKHNKPICVIDVENELVYEVSDDFLLKEFKVANYEELNN